MPQVKTVGRLLQPTRIRYAVPSLIYTADSCSSRADFGLVGELEHPYQHPYAVASVAAIRDDRRAIYWAGLGHVVYALGEDELLRITGGNPANPTLALPIREVFARGQRVVSVQGPALLEEARAVHDGFWA